MCTTRAIFVIDHVNKNIVGSKTSIKKASKFNSDEYKELVKLMSKHPDYQVCEKEIRHNSSKRTYHGLTIAFMEKFISIQKNRDKLLNAFHKVVNISKEQGRKYTLTKKWFLQTYPDFDIETAKQQIDAAIIASPDKKSAA